MNSYTLRWATRWSCVCLLVLLCARPAQATSNRMADSLSVISHQLFAERNEYFILVEAFKDGYVESGKPFSIFYTEKDVTINGNRLPEESETRYRRLMKDFYSNGSNAPGLSTFTMEGDSISLESDILNPSSNYRTRGPWQQTNRKPSKQLIIEELTRDKLVNPGRPIRLSCTTKAISVNGNALSPLMADKYRMLIRILEGFDAQKESDIYSISR